MAKKQRKNNIKSSKKRKSGKNILNNINKIVNPKFLSNEIDVKNINENRIDEKTMEKKKRIQKNEKNENNKKRIQNNKKRKEGLKLQKEKNYKKKKNYKNLSAKKRM
jgi:hypothetical protein